MNKELTDKEILKKVIEKARSNGFKGSCGDVGGVLCEAHSPESESLCSYTTIFNHEFAKALWAKDELRVFLQNKETKEERVVAISDYRVTKEYFDSEDFPGETIIFLQASPGWMWHLQEMALSSNPIQYLKAFL